MVSRVMDSQVRHRALVAEFLSDPCPREPVQDQPGFVLDDRDFDAVDRDVGLEGFVGLRIERGSIWYLSAWLVRDASTVAIEISLESSSNEDIYQA
jgi:hypothetical protein